MSLWNGQMPLRCSQLTVAGCMEQPGLPLLFDASSWNWGAKSFGLCCARTWQVGNMGKTISAICCQSRWELSIVSLTPCHCSLVSYPAKLDFKVFHEGATISKLFIDCSTKWQERDHVSGRSAGSAAVREVGDIGIRWDERLSGLSAASMQSCRTKLYWKILEKTSRLYNM